jgi:hypothetical protein
MRPVFHAARYPEYGPGYAFAFSTDCKGLPSEGAAVRFAWNDNGLFVAADLEDAHRVSLIREDEQLHYTSGDVLELFLKPRHAPYKWEMYVTPFGNKSTLFFPEWPCQQSAEECLVNHDYRGLEVSVEETAAGWKARLFVPASQLTALGAAWAHGAEWTVLCGRYNYDSAELRNPECSMAPALRTTDFHLIDEYARLELGDSLS